ncbi:cellulose binding domain-containing protein [Goodfellowiella coeruleoviolacea]|uniref:cellulose binding domain-containing protein n=1 Tax=Goodfellowiella coeruleoviolacea TaxID=334858 RepID=UPI0020A25C23|nr:cellulose binding domain-containing protein [Goodfellowiella coeruleoviolacea]
MAAAPGDGQRISQAWNAAVTQSGMVAMARNLTWNGALPPGGSASFGFQASWTGANVLPAVSCALG